MHHFPLQGCPRALLPSSLAHVVQYRCAKRLRATADKNEEFGAVEGNRDLQDALVEQLRVQVQNETLREEIRDDLKGKVQGIKEIGDDLINQLDAELGIEKFRMELESNQVLSEANEKFNELEEQLQQIKDQIKADQADLRAFEVSSANARSQGLFFRSLYQPEADEDADTDSSNMAAAGSKSSSSSNSKQLQKLLDPNAAAAAVVASPAKQEMASPFRMYLFGYMAAVLALVVVQDLLSTSSKPGLDGLYGMIGLLLGLNAYRERQTLLQVLPHEQQQQAAGKDDSSEVSAESSSDSNNSLSSR